MDVPQHINKRMHDYFKPSPKKLYISGQHNQCTLKVHVFADFELAIHTHRCWWLFQNSYKQKVLNTKKANKFIIIIYYNYQQNA